MSQIYLYLHYCTNMLITKCDAQGLVADERKFNRRDLTRETRCLQRSGRTRCRVREMTSRKTPQRGRAKELQAPPQTRGRGLRKLPLGLLAQSPPWPVTGGLRALPTFSLLGRVCLYTTIFFPSFPYYYFIYRSTLLFRLQVTEELAGL